MDRMWGARSPRSIGSTRLAAVTTEGASVPIVAMVGAGHLATAVQAQAAVLRGWVVDSAGQPITGAQVQIVGTSHRATIGENGAFRLEGIGPGRHSLLTRAIGFRPDQRTVIVGGTADSIRIVLDPMPQLLDEVVVTPETDIYEVRLRNFSLRVGSTRGGRVFREEEIQRRGRHHLGHLLGHFFGISPGTFNHPAEFGGRRRPTGCVPGLVVNGGNLETTRSIADFKAEDIEAIEAYPSAPLEYRSQWTQCGLVVIWLKNYVPPGFGERGRRP